MLSMYLLQSVLFLKVRVGIAQPRGREVLIDPAVSE